MVWNLLMKIARWCLNLCFRIVGKELSDDAWQVFEQFFKFLLVGLSNTVVVLAVYYIVVWLGGTQYYLLGQTLGYAVGIVNSFFWNSKLVFSHSREAKGLAFVKMCACYGITYVIQMGLLYAFVEWLSMTEWLAPVVAIIITTPINFVLNKILAFRDRTG